MAEADFTPIEPNPYIVGNPVRNPEMFFGRKFEFQLVRKHFTTSSGGMLFVFCGERRSGKTSILFQIRDGRLGPEFLPVLIDMQAMAIETEADFFSRIAKEAVRSLHGRPDNLEPPDFDGATNPTAIFEDFVDQLCALYPDRTLVLLFDEYELMEDKVNGGQLSEGVFRIFSHLMERTERPVFFVFTGSQHLDERGHHVWSILAKSHFKRIAFLERSDALNLIVHPVEGRVEYAEDTIERIYRLAAGQPFYTQWICQNLVDYLNEHRTNVATGDAIASVTKGLINNPAPEMTRLWGDLNTDERLTLALLAEVLEHESEFTTSETLLQLARRSYPISADLQQIATASESLIRNELLLRHPDDQRKGYQFRMDIWRLWVRRSHSVWQVIQENQIPVRTRWYQRKGSQVAAMALLLPLLGWGGYAGWQAFRQTGEGRPAIDVTPPPQFARLELSVIPEEAGILVEGQLRARGMLVDEQLRPDHPYVFNLQAGGYHDSTFTLQFDPGDERTVSITLRPQVGSILVQSTPGGGEVWVGGQRRGESPYMLSNVPVTTPVTIRVSAERHRTETRSVRSIADTTITELFRLDRTEFSVDVWTIPSGAAIALDGVNHAEPSPTTIAMTEDQHRISAVLDGYLPVDTVVTIADDTPLHFTMSALPPGILVAKGDQVASIYVDGERRSTDTYNSGQLPFDPGPHEVTVEFRGGATIDTTIHVPSGQVTEYNFTKGTVTRRDTTFID